MQHGVIVEEMSAPDLASRRRRTDYARRLLAASEGYRGA
jgi:hypothetical protein